MSSVRVNAVSLGVASNTSRATQPGRYAVAITNAHSKHELLQSTPSDTLRHIETLYQTSLQNSGVQQNNDACVWYGAPFGFPP